MPENQKIENQLQASLNATPEEFNKSVALHIGYDDRDKMWELIVKYHGDLLQYAEDDIMIEELLAGYAIVNIPQNKIYAFSQTNEVEYIEKPKRLFFSATIPVAYSCILPISKRAPFLQGEGTVVAVIDSGIDVNHPDFKNPDGTTRILDFWDQSLSPDPARGFFPPAGFSMGVEFSENDINAALAVNDPRERFAMLPAFDATGHGTAVAGIAAGNGAESGGLYAGVAPLSKLLIVKLGLPRTDSFPRTTELMRALSYAAQYSIENNIPVAINLSIGTNYGSHYGDSILERFINNVSETGKCTICVGSGNGGSDQTHVGANIAERNQVDLVVGDYKLGTSVGIWLDSSDSYQINILSPSRNSYSITTDRYGTHRLKMENTNLLIQIGEASPFSTHQEIFIDLIPSDVYIDSGAWSFELTPRQVLSGNYHFYVPSDNGTRLSNATPEMTLTIPSTAQKVITVGAYNPTINAYAEFSGRGYDVFPDANNTYRNIKPDIAAPGVDIISAANGGGYGEYTGTSFAAPIVTGAAALLMEWGIIRGNDSYMYGEKVKAALRKGAAALGGVDTYPNSKVGYGALCVEQSITR